MDSWFDAAGSTLSTQSAWFPRHLESRGHEVIVPDPNQAPMNAKRSRRTKTESAMRGR